MTEASARRLELARSIAAVYEQDSPVRALLVTGSVALGESDDASDIDLILYYDALPSPEEIKKTRVRVGGSEQVYFFGSADEGGFVEAYYIEGIKHDFAHVAIAHWETDMAEILEQHKVDSPLQKAIAGLLDGIPLFGADIIAPWKAKAAQYPDALAEAMVAHHLKFYPPWVAEKMALERGDLLFLYEIFTQAGKNILGVLLGLNRIYHWGEYKRMDSFLARMTVAPPDLSARLKRMLRAEPPTAVTELDSLIRETFALVETHLPYLDIAAAKARYQRPLGS